MMSDEPLGDSADQIIFDDIPDYLSAVLGNPDTSVNTDGVYTRVWTDERIAASELKDAVKVRDMKITLHNMQTGETTDLGEAGIVPFNTEWSINQSRLDTLLWNLPATEYTLSGRLEWTATGRSVIDSLIYGMTEEARQDIGRKLLEFTEYWAILNGQKPRRSRRAARRRLSKRRSKR